ncbi:MULTISPECIES: carbon monoxide dehydrogenase subunit G [unclassified Mesorhizobium]|uniref:CoxG family protein n=1 Tax=unclassified Mesorhizobium TaxID=325217 RepID=UPI000FD7F853|nr:MULTISPECIES: carbon monoxide dehydrogenase subunit G [unclassified Mesorhizobium]TGR18802.1 carbon monoxide dehydrogenase [Mesorhizobium sp. M8A.F.Ca.ET.197.01.1.1]TGR37066.1 carbon monoxide dehydrogenase [bacterium M00.F.Ca.ET.199.01.1.1]TGR41596.1 carbon monoxide dehydrogenase [Mesorhizobium sp. M8A.F.Ca.ET.198.01.1.1]TGV85307.1 carbon monoxide dehydrogenase [Mesorhizobium sp. M00.F.Ca.ET.149.01.1.1]
MEFSGQYTIAMPRERVWTMLNDSETLRACIPGCQSLEASAEEGFAATVKIGVGPIKATFNGTVELVDLDPPSSYRIVGAGKGGAAGFASGEARVRLGNSDAGTILNYEVEVKIGGKLAQLGSRLLQSTTSKLADQFFAAFAARAASVA